MPSCFVSDTKVYALLAIIPRTQTQKKFSSYKSTKGSENLHQEKQQKFTDAHHDQNGDLPCWVSLCLLIGLVCEGAGYGAGVGEHEHYGVDGGFLGMTGYVGGHEAELLNIGAVEES